MCVTMTGPHPRIQNPEAVCAAELRVLQALGSLYSVYTVEPRIPLPGIPSMTP